MTQSMHIKVYISAISVMDGYNYKLLLKAIVQLQCCIYGCGCRTSLALHTFQLRDDLVKAIS